MQHAGLDISDDGIRCIEYRRNYHGLTISKFASQEFPVGLVENGEIKDEKEFSTILSDFIAKNNLLYVKVSIPEEKAYLFQTDVQSLDFKSIAQNIEFKLDQNVPLSAPDALFQFDLMPQTVVGNLLRASVSVVPRTYIEHYVALIRATGAFPVAFEVVPKSIVLSYVSHNSNSTQLVVHIMKKKTGFYIVSEGVVCFTSTISWGSDEIPLTKISDFSINTIMNEINKVYSYWTTRSDVHSDISEVIVVGSRAKECESLIRNQNSEIIPRSALPDVWHNAFNINKYIPAITKAQSLEYAIAAGLAL